MKKASRIIVKAFFAIVLLTTGAVIVNTNGVNTVSEAKAATYQQVYNYLTSRGYEVVTLAPYAKCQWLAHTVKGGIHYWTTVYENTAGEIIGHTDVLM